MHEFLERIGLELPIVQAGMGGGIAGSALATAVSAAGGLGTLGTAGPSRMAAWLAEVRQATDKPIAMNLLLPFARAAHWKVAAQADVVVTFWGRPQRFSTGVWIHQVGTVAESRAAFDAGADAVIVQGVEAGGHVRGTVPALELLEQTRAALPAGYPILLAGGIADANDVEGALAAGAAAVVAGTRFVMSDESGAAPEYKVRLANGSETVLTELFGVGWPGAHRVLRNGATERWLRHDQRGPAVVRGINRLTAPALARVPEALQQWTSRHQLVALPFFAPVPPTGSMNGRILETAPLYAGETVARITDIAPAASIVRSLTPG
ncbi:nitronate monooxygenase family protein [Antrihabitans sp. YC2-6]|uniref:NAD(P)H-dependent flavin oxidoreductase n=1 Tax=Antrihabitans sp. YC2-6 TaxID=2799498 RepID=UPI0018F7527D|nr:nitronate monooxygenase [Antrihabitans sp. YC2-6]MBJ8347584.1 nitronate monooxygenase [Antrihabitans sp. YC2-6]